MLFMVQRSIERAAQHEAKRTEQKARGELERQKLQNEKVFIACIVSVDTTHGDTVTTVHGSYTGLLECVCIPFVINYYFVWHGSKAFVST